MVIVDSTVWIDYLADIRNTQTVWLDQQLAGNGPVQFTRRIALADLVLCEVLQGFREEAKFQLIRVRLTTLPVLNTGGVDLAVSSARNYRRLRSRGVTIRKTIDCLIATLCIENGHSLLHRDRDFDAFETHLGLQVIHP